MSGVHAPKIHLTYSIPSKISTKCVYITEKSTSESNVVLKPANKRKEVGNSWTQVATVKQKTDEGVDRNDGAEVIDNGSHVTVWEDVTCIGPVRFRFRYL